MNCIKNQSLKIAILGTSILGTTFTFAQLPKMDGISPDNSLTNRGNKSGRVTADQLDMNSSDTELVRKIREGITQDNILSTYAKNVNIMASNGTITLKGPVESANEKQIIVRKVQTVVGVNRIKNELTIVK